MFSCSDTFCMSLLLKGIAFTQKTTTANSRCGTFFVGGGGGRGGTLIRRPRANSYECNLSLFVFKKNATIAREKHNKTNFLKPIPL